MIKTIIASIALLTVTAPATAGIVYMTGNNDPWNQSSEDSAMDKAFGAGNWTKINGFTTSALTGSSFVYIDGGADTSADFNSFVSSNLAALESYVTAGGSLVLNAARWNFNPGTLNTVFGSTITGDDNYSAASGIADLTAAGAAAGLGANGAGSSWTGSYFSHDVVSGGTCMVSGSAGCAFTVGTAGAGSWGVGGQTAPAFQSTGGLELRANELQLVASGGTGGIGAVPEPASWAMMIAGFGLVGASARRRRGVLATA
jgi:PEP-CTERM motif